MFTNITESQTVGKTRQGCKREAEEFDIGTTTVCKLRKQMQKLLNFYAEWDEQK